MHETGKLKFARFSWWQEDKQQPSSSESKRKYTLIRYYFSGFLRAASFQHYKDEWPFFFSRVKSVNRKLEYFVVCLRTLFWGDEMYEAVYRPILALFDNCNNNELSGWGFANCNRQSDVHQGQNSWNFLY